MKDNRKNYCLIYDEKNNRAYELLKLVPQPDMTLAEAEHIIMQKNLKLVKDHPAGFKVFA